MRIFGCLFSALVVSLSVWGCASNTEPAQPASPERVQPPTQPAAPASGAECITAACELLASQLAAKLPPDKSIAVLPLLDGNGAIRVLGQVVGEEVRRLLLEKGLRLVARESLDAVLRERTIQMTLATSDADTRQRIGELAKADVLVVGYVLLADSEVLVSQEAVQVDTGRSVAITRKEVLPAANIGGYLAYIRRPTAAQASGELPPLALRYQFVTPSGSDESVLADGSTVSSGQKFKVRVQTNSDCHLYVLLYDSAGQASILFPHAKIGLGNEISGGANYEIPEGTKWYWFDETPGVETFYLVASYAPLPDLNQILTKMQEAGGQKIQLATAAREKIDDEVTRGMVRQAAKDYSVKGFKIQERGVDVVDTRISTDRRPDIGEVDNVVRGYATVVKKIMLNHR